MQTAEIRRRWLKFFADRGHTVVPSASLISNDPSILFTIAGMVPFIPYITGQEKPPFSRATSVQKCVRTNDIDEVGITTRHGTFFQMNGNFSFGDYFKEGAIGYAWELLTGSVEEGCYGLDPDKLWVTVYEQDAESVALWKRIAGLPDERIVRFGRADAFWSTGQPGPAGPCSEIYYDRGPAYGPDGGPAVDTVGDRFLEVWNLVFDEYIRGEGNEADYPLVGDLEMKCIDTGMGLERVAFLLQGVDNMYEIDQVKPVLDRAAELTGKRYGASHEDDVRLRVIADHVRSALMLVSDGVTPANEGRGYVLRRLLRRSVRAMRLLGYDDPALPELLPVSKDSMAASYPELETDFARISTTAYAEEEAFRRTLDTGTKIFDLRVDKVREAGGTTISGSDAFALHDTYGFPIDLTLEMARERGLRVDEAGFRSLMAEQRARAQADSRSRKTGHSESHVLRDVMGDRPTEFLGYDELTVPTTVRAIIRDGVTVPVAHAGETVEVVLDATPFYAESGGQIADRGHITGDGVSLTVTDVQKPIKGLYVHRVTVDSGELHAPAPVEASVDREWRMTACQAHSATHVVNAALHQLLGPTALQAGSYNKPGYLRLDYTWSQPMSAETRSEMEDVSNLAIRDDLPVSVRQMPLQDAKDWGAQALFGERYPQIVRVVQIGGPWSRELCGGTHVAHSSQIGPLVLTTEQSVGTGHRRIEAHVGLDGFRYLAQERSLVTGLTDLLKVPADQLTDRVSGLLDRLKQTQRQVDALRRAQLAGQAATLAGSARPVGAVALVAHDAGEVASADELRTLAADVRGRLEKSAPTAAGRVVALAGVAGGRPLVVVATDAGARSAGLRAGALVRSAARVLGGGGGGKDDLAQGGGTDAARVPDALRAVEDAVTEAVPAR